MCNGKNKAIIHTSSQHTTDLSTSSAGPHTSAIRTERPKAKALDTTPSPRMVSAQSWIGEDGEGARFVLIAIARRFMRLKWIIAME